MNRQTYTRILTGIVAVAAVAGPAVASYTHDAPVGGWVGFDYADRGDVPVNVPTFTEQDAIDHPNCNADTSGVTRKLVVDGQGVRTEVAFGVAYRITHLDPESDVWVIGSCR